MNIKVTKLDRLFSKLVRALAGWKCERCHKQFPPNSRTLHNSHYFGRRAVSTRWSLLNCSSICFSCHQYFGSNPHDYYEWQLDKLGPERYGELVRQFNATQKKTKQFMEDRMEAIKEMLDGAERI